MSALRILIILLLIVLGIVGGLWLSQQDMQFGQVLIRVGGYDIATSIPKLGIAVLLAFVILGLLWKLVAMPVNAWIRRRRKKSRVRLVEGLGALNEGRWAHAERLLSTTGKDAEVGTIALVAATRAADALGDEVAVQKLLQRLAQRNATVHLFLQADRALADDHPETALDLLDDPALQPLPPRGLLLRIQALSRLGRAKEAYGLLGALRRTDVLMTRDWETLETNLARQSLQEAEETQALAERWETMPKALQKNPAIVSIYAERAARLGWDEAAMRSIEKALDKHWDEALIVLYGQLPISTEDNRLSIAQRWAVIHPESGGLSLTLGRLLQKQHRWEEAQEHLERALTHGAGPAAWEVLGDGHAALGDTAAAARCYANALKAERGESVQDPPHRDLLDDIQGSAVSEDRNEHGFPKLTG